MNGAAILFFAVLAAGIATASALALLLRSRLRRRHRVHPKVRTDAPVTWLADPRTPARLHRRLAKVGHTAGAVAVDHRAPRKVRRRGEESPLVGVAEQLQARAVRLDHELARVAMLPKPARHEPLGQLRFAVSDLEQACLELVTVSARLRTPAVLATDGGDITDVAAHVQRIAQAHEELLRIDHSHGLVPDATQVLAPRQVAGGQRG